MASSQQSAMPGGGWRQTARNITVSDGTLTAELQKVDGSWVEASVELAGDSSQCELDNIDGVFAPAQPSARLSTPTEEGQHDNIDYDVASWYRTEEGLEYPHDQQDQESQHDQEDQDEQEDEELEQMEAELESIASQLADDDQHESSQPPEPEPSPADEAAAAEIAKEVAELQAEAKKLIAPAGPIIQAAEAALASLSTGSLTELKAFRSPPEAVIMVTSATLILTAGNPQVPEDLSWAAAQKMLGNNVGQFLDSLLHYDKDHIDEVLVAAVEAKFLSDPEFDPEKIRSKSGAAAALCSWCINLCKYSRI
eukprot:COSAG04_NODE_6722_length_1269_cov_1.344444_1_plen_309_part_10